MKEELKPCPFCGEPDDVRAYAFFNEAGEEIGCHITCLVCLGSFTREDAINREEVIEAWNRRPDPEQKKEKWIIIDGDRGDGSYADYIEFQCPHCKDTFGIESGQYDWFWEDDIPWKACPMCGKELDGGIGVRWEEE